MSDPDGPSTQLLREWTQLQLDQAAKAVYTDDAAFHIVLQPPGGVSSRRDLILVPNDYEDTSVTHVDPERISVRGVNNIAGIDISYDTTSDCAIVALVILAYPSLKLKHTFLQDVIPTQPYVPSFLSMRELEHVERIYDHASYNIPEEDRPDVVFVDGFGRWHERQAGLATALGVSKGIVTIGIGKEYQPLRPDLGDFIGLSSMPSPMPPWPETDHFRSKQKSFREVCRAKLQQQGDFLGIPLHRGGPLVGAAMYTAPGRRKAQTPSPLYISPGNKISLESALLLTLTCCVRNGIRQPEPIILADRAGRDELQRRKVVCASQH